MLSELWDPAAEVRLALIVDGAADQLAMSELAVSATDQLTVFCVPADEATPNDEVDEEGPTNWAEEDVAD